MDGYGVGSGSNGRKRKGRVVVGKGMVGKRGRKEGKGDRKEEVKGKY